MGAFVVTAAARGELPAAWAWNDDEGDEATAAGETRAHEEDQATAAGGETETRGHEEARDVDGETKAK